MYLYDNKNTKKHNKSVLTLISIYPEIRDEQEYENFLFLFFCFFTTFFFIFVFLPTYISNQRKWQLPLSLVEAYLDLFQLDSPMWFVIDHLQGVSKNKEKKRRKKKRKKEKIEKKNIYMISIALYCSLRIWLHLSYWMQWETARDELPFSYKKKWYQREIIKES